MDWKRVQKRFVTFLVLGYIITGFVALFDILVTGKLDGKLFAALLVLPFIMATFGTFLGSTLGMPRFEIATKVKPITFMIISCIAVVACVGLLTLFPFFARLMSGIWGSY